MSGKRNSLEVQARPFLEGEDKISNHDFTRVGESCQEGEGEDDLASFHRPTVL